MMMISFADNATYLLDDKLTDQIIQRLSNPLVNQVTEIVEELPGKPNHYLASFSEEL